jgi:hypothetical protein
MISFWISVVPPKIVVTTWAFVSTSVARLFAPILLAGQPIVLKRQAKAARRTPEQQAEVDALIACGPQRPPPGRCQRGQRSAIK